MPTTMNPIPIEVANAITPMGFSTKLLVVNLAIGVPVRCMKSKIRQKEIKMQKPYAVSAA
jgi:hypothetical protein